MPAEKNLEKTRDEEYQEYKLLAKDDILEQIEKVERVSARNSMGCDESYYNPYFALKDIFGKKKLKEMDVCELQDLLILASSLADAFY